MVPSRLLHIVGQAINKLTIPPFYDRRTMCGGGDLRLSCNKEAHQQTEASNQILGNIPLLLLTVAYFPAFLLNTCHSLLETNIPRHSVKEYLVVSNMCYGGRETCEEIDTFFACIANGVTGEEDFFWETLFAFGLLLDACMFLWGFAFSVASSGGFYCVYDMWLGVGLLLGLCSWWRICLYALKSFC